MLFCVEQIIILRGNFYFFFLSRGTGVINIRKPSAGIKCHLIDFCDAFRDSYTFKPRAAAERITAYACNAAGNIYTCKAVATVERGKVYFRNSVGNVYTCKAAAT